MHILWTVAHYGKAVPCVCRIRLDLAVCWALELFKVFQFNILSVRLNVMAVEEVEDQIRE